MLKIRNPRKEAGYLNLLEVCQALGIEDQYDLAWERFPKPTHRWVEGTRLWYRRCDLPALRRLCKEVEE
jgi:hypothetical protein